MKRVWIVAVCCVILLAALPFAGVAQAEPMSIGELMEKYPNGAYWNHTKGGNEDYTWTPCTHHVGNCTYNGSCGCNTYKNMAIQCMGFAYQLAALAYDCDPRTQWDTYRTASALDNLKAGDIVRYQWNGHSIFVTAVEGNTVTYADCNSDGKCGIAWHRTTTKEKLKASFTYVKTAPYALPALPGVTVGYDAVGGTIDNQVVSHTYRILSDNGLNLRKDAGTSYGKVTALPYNTLFTVAVGDTKEADGYVWGKTTYGDKTGWLVISDYVELVRANTDGEWCVKDGIVCRADGTPLQKRYYFGETLEGICAPDEVGLHREGYRFMGWNTAADGSGVTVTAETMAEEICPEGEDSVVLYAQWHYILAGDADGDGRLNNRDLGLLQRYLNDWDVSVYPEVDINGDGTVNNKDLGLLQQALNNEEE